MSCQWTRCPPGIYATKMKRMLFITLAVFLIVQIDAISENNVNEITNFTQKLRRTNQKLLEQFKDSILLN